MENLAKLTNLVLTGGNTHLEAVGLDMFSISAIGLIVILLAARIVRRKYGRLLNFSRGRRRVTNKRGSGRLFERQRSSVLKACPNCAEQLSLSAVICNICEYNFLAERPGRGQNLLPSPQPMTYELPDQQITPVT